MDESLSKKKKNLSRLRKSTNYLLYLIMLTLILSTFPSLTSAESVKIVSMHNLKSEGWNEEVLNLPANGKIELGNYSIDYIKFISNNTESVEQISISEKRIDDKDFEKYHQIRSFSGAEEIKELKNKSILLQGSNIAFSLDSYEYDNLKLRICSKKDVFSEINMSTTIPEFILLYQDESVNIPIKINNRGLIDEIISLEATESDSYTHKFMDGSYRVNKVALNSGEIKDIYLELKVDKYCTPGEYNFTINASGRSSFILNIPFTVEEDANNSEKDLAIQLSKLYVSGKAGSEITIPVRIINSGDSDLKDIKLAIEPPVDSWEIDASKKKIKYLKSKEYENVDLIVRIPAEAENGDYFVDIKGSADGIKAEETKLRVNVKPQSNSAWIGMLIIVSVISCLFVVYRKYGRR